MSPTTPLLALALAAPALTQFAPPRAITEEVNPYGVQAVDLDADGDADLLAASAPRVLWYENLGAGSFGAPSVISSSDAFDASAGDLDGDGDPDVLAAESSVFWIENLGAGSFGAEHPVAAQSAADAHLEDLDGDGDLDVVAAGFDRVVWYENLGAGVFGPEQLIALQALPRTVHTADLDGDGDPDVLSATGFKIAWYENLGGGAFGGERLLTASANVARGVWSADLDGDGDLDVMSGSQAKVAWFENLGSGSFSPLRLIEYRTSAVVRAADLDGDGDADILSGGAQEAVWYENNGAGLFAPARGVAPANGVRGLDAADLDGDGDPDVATASLNDGRIAWAANSGSGFFAEVHDVTQGTRGATGVFAADLDGDGDRDVLSSSSNDDKIAWYENLGAGGFGEQQVITNEAAGAADVTAADLDGDGDEDVISASAWDGTVAWHENLGGAFGPRRIISTAAAQVFSVDSADLDGDGDPDVLSASLLDDKIAWYENLGAGSFGPQQLIAPQALTGDAAAVHTADLDGDGDPDVLSGSGSPDRVAWYENLGAGGFGPQQVISPPSPGGNPISIDTADLDGDGDPDVLYATGERIVWHDNVGAGGFGPLQVVTADAWYASDVRTVDLDGDGDLDVLFAALFENEIAWCANLGAGEFGAPVPLTTMDWGRSVFPADLDGDGDGDVVFATQDAIGWSENLLSTPLIGTLYCTPAVPNSSGLPGRIAVAGSSSVVDDFVTLTADQLPPGQFGYFLTSLTQGLVQPPGSQGAICLSGNIGRYNRAGEILQGPAGSLQLDLTSLPVNPPLAALPGDTWNFQCWYRDVHPGPTSNTTDALAVTFATSGEPAVQFPVTRVEQIEDTVQLAVTVSLSQSSEQDVLVPYTRGGTATYNVDWRVEEPNPIVIPAGETAYEMTIIVAEDTAQEGDETAVVTLVTPAGGVLGTAPVLTLTIVDDD